MSKENLKDTMGSLFDGMEGFLTSKTVVGEPIYIKDTIILPLVDVSFGMGAGAFSGDKKDKSVYLQNCETILTKLQEKRPLQHQVS